MYLLINEVYSLIMLNSYAMNQSKPRVTWGRKAVRPALSEVRNICLKKGLDWQVAAKLVEDQARLVAWFFLFKAKSARHKGAR